MSDSTDSQNTIQLSSRADMSSTHRQNTIQLSSSQPTRAEMSALNGPETIKELFADFRFSYIPEWAQAIYTWPGPVDLLYTYTLTSISRSQALSIAAACTAHKCIRSHDEFARLVDQTLNLRRIAE